MRFCLFARESDDWKCSACGRRVPHTPGHIAPPIAPCRVEPVRKPDSLRPLTVPEALGVSPTQASSGGPGTELKKLLKKIGIVASAGCSCNARAAQMDAWGPAECTVRLEEIVSWLQEEAKKRHLPFVRTAARLMVRKAISNSKRRDGTNVAR